MKKNNGIKIFIMIVSFVLTIALTAGVTYIITRRLMWNDMTKLQRLDAVIDQYYIEEHDQEAIEDAAAAAMVDALGNRWSYYVSADEYQSYSDSHTNSYVGIGVVVVLTEDGSGLQIQRLENGGGAMDAGLQPEDVIIEIEGKPVSELGMNGATELIRGEIGSKVSMVILRGEEELTFSVERKKMQTVVATGEMLEGDVGLITIVNFNERSADETLRLVEQLQKQGAKALIFDVRYNPGGYKDEMVKILDHLLPEGDLFRSIDYMGYEEVDTSDKNCLDIPMVVLVIGDSYSAAEFFAAALHEYEWATVVGTPTTGKSHFQISVELGDGSAVNISAGKYFTPNGVSLADVGGLEPDVVVEVDEETYMQIYYGNVPPQEDPQIAAALEVLKKGE